MYPPWDGPLDAGWTSTTNSTIKYFRHIKAYLWKSTTFPWIFNTFFLSVWTLVWNIVLNVTCSTIRFFGWFVYIFWITQFILDYVISRIKLNEITLRKKSLCSRMYHFIHKVCPNKIIDFYGKLSVQ